MRVAGLNVWVVIGAAVAMYAIGFLIYGLAFGDMWQKLNGYTPESFQGLEWRMALSPVMPILGAIGIALAIKWRNAFSLGGGVLTGLLVLVCFTLPARLYGFVYGNEPEALLLLDSAHLALTHIVAGAILGVWK